MIGQAIKEGSLKFGLTRPFIVQAILPLEYKVTRQVHGNLL